MRTALENLHLYLFHISPARGADINKPFSHGVAPFNISRPIPVVNIRSARFSACPAPRAARMPKASTLVKSSGASYSDTIRTLFCATVRHQLKNASLSKNPVLYCVVSRYGGSQYITAFFTFSQSR